MRRLPALLLAGMLLVPALAACSSDDGDAGPTPSASAGSPSPSPTMGTGRFPQYVALGDSYTAAPGVPTQDPNDGCQRSSSNYPNLVATHFTGSALIDVSCSGADTTALVGVQTTADGVVHPAQFDPLSKRTSLVTIGIGGNDEGIASLLFAGCLGVAQSDPTGSPCADSQRTKVETALRSLRSTLTAAFKGIVNRAPKATVVAVGYPQIIPASGTCDALPIAEGDVAFAREINQGLDDDVKAAAAAAGIEFADVWSATEGHDICSDDPWINGAQNAPGKAIPFHPFAAEQKAAAQAVIDVLGN